MDQQDGDASSRSAQLDEVIAEYLASVEAGTAVDRDQLLAKHAHLAEDLKSFFANDDRMRAAATTEAPTMPFRASGLEDGDGSHRTPTTVRYFGDYELLAEIARGGMGVVYRARQLSLNRIVAVKMILVGQLASEEDVQRFYAEAEAAAKLDHPGIVPIFEVGEHEGQHYFSMGFVEGESLGDKIKDGPLPPRVAAEYTKKVAKAMAFAHERGVIHRDLKPANVLLDQNDEPKVTDFGLAKKVEGDSRLTATGQILGTPSYMPPEQASGKIDEITETADVYSLGAILYALMTGRPPFQADNHLDTLLQVLEREPVSPQSLNAKVPRDLETICLKCLAKDRTRRYLTATEVGEELGRFLNVEPILARPIGAPARLWRWSRRNPLVAALSTTAVLLLIAVAVIGTVGYVQTSRGLERETEQRELAQHQGKRAEENFQKARNVVDEFFTDVSESRELLKGTPGTQRLRKRLLERAQKYYEDFARRREADKKLQPDLALAHFRLAQIAAETGEKPKALAAFQKALQTLQPLARENPSVTLYQDAMARCHNNIGALHSEIGKRDEALADFQKVIEILQRLARENPAVTEHQDGLGRSFNNIGYLHYQSGKSAEALTTYQMAIEIQERLVRNSPSVTAYEDNLARSYNNLGLLHLQTSRLAEALSAYRKSIEIRERLARDNPTVSRNQYDLAASYGSIGLVHSDIHKPAEALAAYQKAIEIHERLVRENPAVTEFQNGLAKGYNNIGILHRGTDKPAEALAAYRKAIEIQERLVREDPAVSEYQSDLAKHYTCLGNLHSETEKPAEAVAAYQEAIEIRERLVRDYPTVVDYAVSLGGICVNLGNLVRKIGELEAALDWYRRGIETLEKVLKRVPRNAKAKLSLYNAHWGRALTIDKLKRYAEATGDWERALELDTGQRSQFFRSRLGSSVARAGDHVRAAHEAKALAKAAKANGSVFYNAACVYSLAVVAAAQDKSLEQTERSTLADEYALHAIDLLKRAQAAGYFKAAANVEHMKKDADLDSLRMRTDFKKLLAEIVVTQSVP